MELLYVSSLISRHRRGTTVTVPMRTKGGASLNSDKKKKKSKFVSLGT